MVGVLDTSTIFPFVPEYAEVQAVDPFTLPFDDFTVSALVRETKFLCHTYHSFVK